MAKDAKDKSEDRPAVFIPATQDDLRNMLNEYETLNADKTGKADAQKLLLERFNQKHSLPPKIAKIIRSFDKMDDDDRAHAWRALKHAGAQLGFDDQYDLEDYAANDGGGDPDPDGTRTESVTDEEWDEAAPKTDQDGA